MLRIFTLIVALLGTVSTSHAREWTDETGLYALEAELFGFDDEYVVLQRGDKELGRLKIAELSERDREYLRSEDAVEVSNKNLASSQTWTMARGQQLVGRIVDFARQDITIQRRRGRTYLNDRRLANLPEMYRKLLPEVIEYFQGVAIPNERAMQNWLRSLNGQPRTFQLDGVKLEVENGDEHVIPFFVFSPEDQKWLKANWADWLAFQHEQHWSSDHAFRLEALAAAHFKNQAIQREIALIDLNLQAIRAGLTSAWEVTLYPDLGNFLPPRWVVMLGRDSNQATLTALQQNPGFVAGPVRRISR